MEDDPAAPQDAGAELPEEEEVANVLGELHVREQDEIEQVQQDEEPAPEELVNNLGDEPSDTEEEEPITTGKGEGRGGGGKGAGPRLSKYKFHDLAAHSWTQRAEWLGPEFPHVAPHLQHLTWQSEPYEFFQQVDGPDRKYFDRAANSELYRSYRHFHELDGRNREGRPIKSYDGASHIEYADMRYLDASALLNGLDPAVSREKMLDVDRLAIKGHRVGDLFDRARYGMVRKFHHPTDPKKQVPRGSPGHDNLFQVCNILQSLREKSERAVVGGKRRSVDEETLSFQGAHAELKQNSGRYKAAGDGLQCDAECCEGGFLQGFTFRGHSLSPKVTVLQPTGIKLSPLHQRVVYCLYLSKCASGNEVGMDNLYNSVEFSHILEKGAKFKIEVPKSASAPGEVIEWNVKGIHTIGTLRGNRGSEKLYTWKDSMPAAVARQLREKPLIPDRVKVRVTDDEAQVMTVSIYDNKVSK